MSPYQILGIPETSSLDEVKTAYRRLAKKYHPDLNKDRAASVRFNQIAEAYQQITSPEKNRTVQRPEPQHKTRPMATLKVTTTEWWRFSSFQEFNIPLKYAEHDIELEWTMILMTERMVQKKGFWANLFGLKEKKTFKKTYRYDVILKTKSGNIFSLPRKMPKHEVVLDSDTIDVVLNYGINPK